MKRPKPVDSIDMPLYGGVVHLYTNRAKCQKAMACWRGHPVEFTSHSVGVSDWYDDPKKGRIYVIGVFTPDAGILSHELNHIALAALERAGINAHHASGEPFCYLQQSLFYSFWPRIQKLGK